MSKIFFKFKAAKDYDSCVFDGPSLSVFDLKKEIMLQKKLGKGLDFDLSVCDAQTSEELTDDQYQVPRNSSVIVRRVPAASGHGTAQRYLSGAAYIPRGVQLAAPASSIVPPSATASNPASSMNGNAPVMSSTAPLPSSAPQRSTIPGAEQPQQLISGATEEDQLQALHQHTGDYWKNMSEELHRSQMSKGLANRPRQPRPPPAAGGTAAPNAPPAGGATYVPTHSFSMRPPPPNYICFRCGVKGHWLQSCPTLGDPNYDNIRVKKPTGIPRTFLKSVAPVEGGGPGVPSGGTLMVTADGERVVAQLNDEVWIKKQGGGSIHLTDDLLYESAREFARESMTQTQGAWIPDHLSCFLCQGLAREAVRMNCCRGLFCDSCIRETLQRQAASTVDQDMNQPPSSHVTMTCPKCTKHADSDNIVVDKPTRAFVEKHLRKVAEEIKRRAAGGGASTAAEETTAPTVNGGNDDHDSSKNTVSSASKEHQPSSSSLSTKNSDHVVVDADKTANGAEKQRSSVDSKTEQTERPQSAASTSHSSSQHQRKEDTNRKGGDYYKGGEYRKRDRSHSNRDNDQHYQRRGSYEKDNSDKKYRYDKDVVDKKQRDDKYYDKGSKYSRDRDDNRDRDYRKRSRSPGYDRHSRKEEDYRKRGREDEDSKYKSRDRGREEDKYNKSNGREQPRGRDEEHRKSSNSRGQSRERSRNEYKPSSRGHSRDRGRDEEKHKSSSRGHSRDRGREEYKSSSSRRHSRDRGRDEDRHKSSNGSSRRHSRERRTETTTAAGHDESRRSSDNRIRSPSPIDISL